MRNTTPSYAIYPLVLLAVLVVTCTSAMAANRVALVIGNGDYGSSPLKNPPNDAKDVAASLKQMGFDVILKVDSSLESIEGAVDRFSKKLKGADAGLFYFAGHGMQAGGENYLIPIGAKLKREKDLRYKALPVGMVLGAMEEGGAKVNIVVLDACRDNPFKRSFRSSSRGLAVVQDVKGTFIAYATSPGSVAADGSGRNGVFTKHLLTNMAHPGVGVETVFKRTRIGVSKETGGMQVPWSSSSLMGDFYFVADGTPMPATSSKPQRASVKVDTEPSGATIYANGSRKGTSPVDITNLKPGGLTIRAEKSGYTPAETALDLKAGQTVFLPMTLTKISSKARLTISPTPPDARVRILNIGPKYRDGMELSAGRYHVEVTKSGYKRFRRWVELDEGQNLMMPISLQAMAAPKATYTPPVVSASANTPQKGDTWTEPTTGMEFVWIPGGCFQMGQTADENEWLIQNNGQLSYDKFFKQTSPLHKVCLNGFWLGKYEVTREQFQKFANATNYKTDAHEYGAAYIMNNTTEWHWQKKGRHNWKNVGFPQDSNHPATIISWNDSVAFAKWLTLQDSKSFRLPTEAEWEYAARAGSTSKWHWGDTPSKDCKFANAADTIHARYEVPSCDDQHVYTAPVGSYRANAFGLHDIIGNVSEWCADNYDKNANAQTFPQSDNGSIRRIIRGGSWKDSASKTRSAYRVKIHPNSRYSSVGFRLVREP